MIDIYNRIKNINTKISNYTSERTGYQSFENRVVKANIFWKHVQRIINVKDGIIDFGCGPGIHIAMAKNVNIDVTGIDIDKNDSEWKQFHDKLGIRNKIAIIEPFGRFPIEDNSINMIYCLSSLKSMFAEKVSVEINRVINENGILIVSPINHAIAIAQYLREDIMLYVFQKKRGLPPKMIKRAQPFGMQLASGVNPYISKHSYYELKKYENN